MSKYIYKLNDYHAIKKAAISIDGITVLSGINGCGKSTLSKWLYYIVNGANLYDEFIYDRYVSQIQNIFTGLNFARRDIDKDTDHSNSLFFREASSKIRSLKDNGEQDKVEIIQHIAKKVIERFCNILYIYLKDSPSPTKRERVFVFLGIKYDEDENLNDVLNSFRYAELSRIEHIKNNYYESKRKRSMDDFLMLMRNKFDIDETSPNNINVEEDGVKLFQKGSVGNLYNLTKAIYVDTPMAVSEEGKDDNVFWNDLKSLMLDENKDFAGTDAHKKIIRRITHLMNGRVDVEKDDFGQKELHFVSEDGLNIKLDKTATGFKSFSYILRLLENGYLNEKTLLLIDEPEAHLHPQWIVEFAHILVLLNKETGTKIMVASHNPNMVDAINAIAKKENVEDRTHFYLAEESEQRFKYIYKDLGQDIEEIFKSFNMAYHKIEQYGSLGI